MADAGNPQNHHNEIDEEKNKLLKQEEGAGKFNYEFEANPEANFA